MCDSKHGKRHLLFPPTPSPTCLQIVETFHNMHHPDLCRTIILTQMSQQHRFGFPKTILNMLVTSENFKTYLVFAECIQEHSLFKVHFSLICGCSFSNARLQPDQPSHNPSCFCTSKCLFQIWFGLQVPFPHHLHLSKFCVSFFFLFKCVLFSPASGIIIFEFLEQIFLFPTSPNFLCSHRFDYTSSWLQADPFHNF